ncbi:MAG: L,D-transpeptidase family protein [Acidimicrobiia bacterium]|nr:L,D-transpeptidase family protein [Acidimicrobiia bacterium]
MSESRDPSPDGVASDDSHAADASVQTAILEPDEAVLDDSRDVEADTPQVVATPEDAPEDAVVDGAEVSAEEPAGDATQNAGNGAGNGTGIGNGNGNGNGAPVLTPGRTDTVVLPVVSAAPLPPPPPWVKGDGNGAGTETRKRRWPKVLMIVGGVVAAFVAAVVIFDFTQQNNVLPGVTVDGVDVGGLSSADATAELEDAAAAALSQVVVGQADGEKHPVTLTDLGVGADVDGAVDAAVDARAVDAEEPSGFRLETVTGPFVRTYHRLLDKPVDVDVEMAYTVDETKRSNWVNGVKAAMDRAPVDARIDVETGAFQVVPSVVGRQLDPVALTNTVDTNARTWALTSFGKDEEVAAEIPFDLPVAILAPAVTEQTLGLSIFVNRSERVLYLYSGAELVETHTVAVGTPGYPTPKGEFEIVEKRANPTWVNPAPNGWGAGMPAKIGPGPSNPLGVRALNLNAAGIRIHGTSNTGSLGSAASHGCVRMANGEIVDFFEKIPVGTRVIIF